MADPERRLMEARTLLEAALEAHRADVTISVTEAAAIRAWLTARESDPSQEGAS